MRHFYSGKSLSAGAVTMAKKAPAEPLLWPGSGTSLAEALTCCVAMGQTPARVDKAPAQPLRSPRGHRRELSHPASPGPTGVGSRSYRSPRQGGCSPRPEDPLLQGLGCPVQTLTGPSPGAAQLPAACLATDGTHSPAGAAALEPARPWGEELLGNVTYWYLLPCAATPARPSRRKWRHHKQRENRAARDQARRPLSPHPGGACGDGNQSACAGAANPRGWGRG